MALSDYRVALVTGASSGIGAALVTMLRERGLEVHAAGRRRERLEALAARTGCQVQVLDVTDAEAVGKLCGELPVDVLVNNAGTTAGFVKLHEADPKRTAEMIAVNLVAVLHLTRAVVPGMIARGRGHIVNVGSVGGHYPAGGLGAYGATKAGVHKFCQDLRLELVGHPIRVTEVSPGRVHTEIHGKALGSEQQAEEMLFRDYEALQPEDVARCAMFALEAPAHVNVGLIEVLPTMQAFGGFQFAKKGQGGGSTPPGGLG